MFYIKILGTSAMYNNLDVWLKNVTANNNCKKWHRANCEFRYPNSVLNHHYTYNKQSKELKLT